jgi:Na+/H+-dicarboxylate symporter
MTNYESKIDYYMTTGRDRTGINVLGLVMFCFVMGYVITIMGEQGKLLYDLFEAINFAFIKIIGFVMM